ncbi:hypothetical protein GQ457_08G033150 [Hibiscus cannabinus]
MEQQQFDDEVLIMEEDIFVDKSGVIPSIQFSDRVHDQVDKNMRNAIIVRLLGRNIMRFVDEGDYTRVLTEGPWTIFGNYLIVQPCTRSFTTSKKHPSQVIVRVRFPGLPFRYYTKTLFRHIAFLIGHVVKVDYNTQEGGRGKFVRLAILVDLEKPLLSCIHIDGKILKLEYEGIQQICFDYGVYVHAREVCLKSVEANIEGATVDTAVGNSEENSISEANLFGPWMQVRNRRRRVDMVGTSTDRTTVVAKIVRGSRFSVLEDDGEAGQEHMVDGGAVEMDCHHVSHDVSIPRPTVINKAQIKRNGAYMASTPERSPKTWSASARAPTVVPLMENQVVNVVSHTPQIRGGSHGAIRIYEQGEGSNVRRTVQGKKGKNSGMT